MAEIWKSLKGIVEYGDSYEVSNLGNVRSIDRYVNSRHGQRFVKGIIMSPSDEKGGYKKVRLKDSSKAKNYRIHRLVALAFIMNPNEFPEVNHKDGNKHNNSVSNLEWSTRSENMNHAYKEGLAKGHNGGNNKNIVMINKDTDEIIRKYDSIKEASIDNEISLHAISMCLNGRSKTSGGYKWKFCD